MIAGPLVPDLAAPRGIEGHTGRWFGSRQSLVLLGAALIGCGIVGAVVWAVFLSPLGFTRYPIGLRDRTFTVRDAGSYVVYFEYPGESRAQLPPALDISVASLRGASVEVRPIGTPGVVSAPSAYDVGGHEGRAVAIIDAHGSGTFVVSVDPVPSRRVDPSQERIITMGTIALGRAWSRSWLGSWGGLVLLLGLPVVAGVGAIAAGIRRGGEPADDR